MRHAGLTAAHPVPVEPNGHVVRIHVEERQAVAALGAGTGGSRSVLATWAVCEGAVGAEVEQPASSATKPAATGNRIFI